MFFHSATQSPRREFQLLVVFLLAMEFHVWIDEVILTVISGFVISSLRFFSVLMWVEIFVLVFVAVFVVLKVKVVGFNVKALSVDNYFNLQNILTCFLNDWEFCVVICLNYHSNCWEGFDFLDIF